MSSENGKGELSPCPVCDTLYPIPALEIHVNKCIFLHSEENTEIVSRKRASPTLGINTDFRAKRSLITPRPSSSKHTTSSKTSKDQKNFPLFSQSQNGSVSLSVAQQSSNLDYSSNTAIHEMPSELQKKKQIDLTFTVPLAKQRQPKTLDDFVGQCHVLGDNTVLRTLIEKGEIPNMILWGPPGCGKTSLSGVVQGICQANSKKMKFISLCAATAGVKDVQKIVDLAKADIKFGRRTVLFMDEIHRFNKKQQDTFLYPVEKGNIILIGATTENPSFCINNALLSRCRVIVMEKLDPSDICDILERTVSDLDLEIVDDDNACLREDDNFGSSISSSSLQFLADISDGDARIALGNLQMVLQHQNSNEINKTITVDDIKEGIKKSHMLYDRKGEEHYNMISAMHKSIRGSDANAALYWTTRMIIGGEDPLYIARRMVRAASEDIGNADPNALQLAVSTMQGCQMLGMPECDCLLAQCAIYLARAPKSREADSALAKAKSVIQNFKGIQPAVPMHIRNAPTKLMKELGYGKLGEDEEFSFMPQELKHTSFFS